MARGGRIVSTTAFKLSAIYLAVFTAFALVFVLSINFAANRLFTQQISDTIASEFANLALAWNDGGVNGLIAAIQDRRNRPGASLYLLADSEGRNRAGNVNEVALVPASVSATAGFRLLYEGIGYNSARAGGNSNTRIGYPEYKAAYSGGRCMRFK